MPDRRTQIAEAGIAILASRGVRALTHLAIDRTLGLAEGSTSYYARTRRDLITLIVDRLAARAGQNLTPPPSLPAELTPEVAASLIAAGLEATARRPDDHRARLMLLLECRNDPQLHDSLATRPPVREAFVRAATVLLRRLGVDRPEGHARDLAGLVDGLLMQRIIRGAQLDEEAVIAAYLRGLPAASR